MKERFFLPVMVALLSVGLLLPLAGCRKNKPEVDACGPAESVGYKVLLQPVISPSKPAGTSLPYLRCEDNKGYSTGSCQLQASLSQSGNLLRLNFCGIGPCGITTDVGPAKTSISLAQLPAQVYQLEITVRNWRTTGTLDLTSTPARLTIADTTVAAVR